MDSQKKNILTDQDLIQDRIYRQVAVLWGIEDPDHLDPLIKLMASVLAFELSSLGQSLVDFQGRALEQLAQLLIPNLWTRNFPAHVLMEARPIEPTVHLEPSQQFYLPVRERNLSGEETVTDHFFSPLTTFPLINGQITAQLFQNGAVVRNKNGRWVEQSTEPIPGISSQDVWLGIELTSELDELGELVVCIDWPSELNEPLALLEQIQWKTTQEALLADMWPDLDGQFKETPVSKVNNKIGVFYNQKLVHLTGSNQAVALHRSKLPPHLNTTEEKISPEESLPNRAWIQVHFPAAFSPRLIRNTRFSLNCIPMVNRKWQRIQKRIGPGANILPVRVPEGYSLLDMDIVRDDQGRIYTPQKPGENGLEGRYALQSTQLERFDRTTAEAFLAKLMRLMREETSIFAAYGQEIMLKQMGDLREALRGIEQRLSVSEVPNREERYFLVVEVPEGISQIEYSFWLVPDPWNQRQVDVGDQLLQYRDIMVQPGSSKFHSKVFPGQMRASEGEKLQSFRHQLLSRNRIVSKSDVKQFIRQRLGDRVQAIGVRNGVSIASDTKKGLVRTIEIWITPAGDARINASEWSQLLQALTLELNQLSVHTANYVIRQRPAPKSLAL